MIDPSDLLFHAPESLKSKSQMALFMRLGSKNAASGDLTLFASYLPAIYKGALLRIELAIQGIRSRSFRYKSFADTIAARHVLLDMPWTCRDIIIINIS